MSYSEFKELTYREFTILQKQVEELQKLFIESVKAQAGITDKKK